MNKDFALGYLLGQGTSDDEKPVPPQQSEIPEEWAPDYERPLPPEIRDDCKFTYLLAVNAQIAELYFVADCAGIIIDWGDGTTETSYEDNSGNFVFSSGGFPNHIYKTIRNAVWIKVLIPKESGASFMTGLTFIREVIRNCGCLKEVYCNHLEGKMTVASDTCYCTDDWSYAYDISSINKEVIFLKSDVIQYNLSLALPTETIYIRVRGTIPAQRFNIECTGELLKSIIIEDASMIENLMDYQFIYSDSSVLSKVIILKATKINAIGTLISAFSDKLKKVQVIAGDKEIKEDGIIIDCPKLTYLTGAGINDSCVSDIDVKINTESPVEISFGDINYGLRNFYVSANEITSPINIGMDVRHGNTYKPYINSIKADIKVHKQGVPIWHSNFFSNNNLNSIFDTIKEFSPPFIPNNKKLIVNSYRNLKKALDTGMFKFEGELNQVLFCLSVPGLQGSQRKANFNTFDDINGLIAVLPKTQSGIIIVTCYNDGTVPKVFRDEINRIADCNLALSKNWKISV